MGASREELEGLIRAADSAGDADSVRVLFGEMDKLTAPKRFGSGISQDVIGGKLVPSSEVDYTKQNESERSELSKWGEALKNVGEAGGQLVSGVGAGVLGNAAGIGATVADIATMRKFDIDPSKVKGDIQDYFTYKPSNPNSLSSKIVSAPGKVFQGSSDYLREKGDKTGLPYVGAVAGAIPEVLANLLGAKAAMPSTVTSKVPYATGGARSVTLPATGKALPPPEVPTTDQLTKASRDAYAAGKESGVIVPADGYAKTLIGVRKIVTEEGLDPTLHPKSTAVMKRLDEAGGKPLSLQEAETLRKIALDAEGDLNQIGQQSADGRLAGKIIDELDDSIEALSTNAPARALWSRSRRSQLIDTMIHRAEIKAGAHYTQAGMEHALRQEFKQLALNPRRMRGLNAQQRAAIEKVAKGGTLENSLRTLGKFDPTSSVVSAAGSAVASGALMAVTGPAAAALPVAGFAAKRGATAMTRRNVDAAREALVGRGLPQAPQMQAPRTSIAPPTPESIPFHPTPGLMPARAAAMSRGLELEQPPLLGTQTFPPASARGMTADVPPPPLLGGLDFKPSFLGDAGDISIAPPAPSYPGGVNFTPSNLSGNFAEAMSRGLRLAPERPIRPKSEARLEMAILQSKIRKLSPEDLQNASYMQALSAEWARLRAELKQPALRAKSP